jgi:hypothetical protein
MALESTKATRAATRHPEHRGSLRLLLPERALACQAFQVTIARIGRFGVQRVLGTGSFATVWLARDEDLDAWVAIKLLAENWSLNEDARRRFIDEARALRRLDDDHIVRVYEIGRLPDDRPFIVMEYGDRGTLEDRMGLRAQLDQPFSVRESVEQSMEIAECLIAVHGCRMVHRDVKPSNVLFRSLSPERQEALRRNGMRVATERTLLGDFGVARRLEGVLGHTMVVGSPHYMAPEQADPGRARHADYRSDIYSAAVILHELITGRLPDPSGRPGIGELRPEVPRSLGQVIEKGLSRDPSGRFGSAWEWRDELRRALLDGAPSSNRDRRAPVRIPDTAMAGATVGGAASASTVRAGREAGPAEKTTDPAATSRGTDVLDPPAGRAAHVVPPTVPGTPARAPARPAPTVSLRLPAAVALASAIAVFVGSLLPWSRDRLGFDFAESYIVMAASAVLFLAGLRMWRTRRRWVAVAASTFASLAGLAAGTVGLFEIIRIAGRDRQGLGSGLLVVLVAGLVAFSAGARALRRLRMAVVSGLPPG